MMTEQEVKQLLIDTQAILERSLPFDIWSPQPNVR